MRIVHINTWDQKGGAARAAYRLHTGLQAAGQRSRMIVGWSVDSPSASGVDAVMTGWPAWRRTLREFAVRVERRSGLQYLLLPGSGRFLQHPFLQSADVIHLHNLHGEYFPYRILSALSRIAPVVWSLHDMWAMTGHCAYAYDCQRWKTGCGSCPYLDETPPLAVDTTALHWRLKARLYRASQLTIVTGSRWMAELARQSPLLRRFAIHTILYGTDLAVFRPLDKATARRTLRIPEDARVVLVFSVSMRRKGLGYFAQALRRLTIEPKPWLLTCGGKLPDPPPGFPVREVGYLQSADEMLNLCYAAADIFVLPTLADNMPLSVLDAMAAGVPSVAFAVGGVPELVRHLETGYLARPQEAADLAAGMNMLLADAPLRLRLGQQARTVAEQDHGLDHYVQQYRAVYDSVLTSSESHDGNGSGLPR